MALRHRNGVHAAMITDAVATLALRYPVAMRKRPPESAPDDAGDDADLFRAAIGADRGQVRALPDAAPPPAAPKPRPSAKMARRDEDAARWD